MLDSGILHSLHAADLSRSARAFLALTCLFVMCSCPSSFQIFSMPVFDMMEQLYRAKWQKKCTPAVRLLSRSLYVLLVLFVAVAFPFLTNLAGLIGGLNSIPVTFAITCFTWCVNWFRVISEMVLSGLVVAAGVGVIGQRGIKLEFSKPHRDGNQRNKSWKE